MYNSEEQNNNQEQTASAEKIYQALQVLCEPKHVYELRILTTNKYGKRETTSGYFDDLHQLANTAAHYSDQGVPACYLTINPCLPALLARSNNRVKWHVSATTADTDIEYRRRLLVDFDPVRPAGISSSNVEHAIALKRAGDCRDWLINKGCPFPLIGDSGNGGHLVYGIDLPNDAESSLLVKNFLDVIHKRFSDNVVKVDLTVFNAARIGKIYGTMTRKGDHMVDRQWRMSTVIDSPKVLEAIPKELLKKLSGTSGLNTTELRQEKARLDGNVFDSCSWLEDFIEKHEIEIKVNKGDNGIWKARHLLEECPFCKSTDNPAVLTVDQENKIGYGCSHDRCAKIGWQEFKLLYEPKDVIIDSIPLTIEKDMYNDYFWDTEEFFRQADKEKINYVVDKLLIQGGVNMLSGLSFAGKTTLEGWLFGHILRGGVLFDEWQTKKQDIIYYNGDRNYIKLLSRYLDAGFMGNRVSGWNYVQPPKIPNTLTADVMKCHCDVLWHRIGKDKPILLAVDTLRSMLFMDAVRGDDLDTIAMTQKLKPFRDFTASMNGKVTILFVYHNARGSNEYYGTGAFLNLLDSCWNYVRPDPDANHSVLTIQTRELREKLLLYYKDNKFIMNKDLELHQMVEEIIKWVPEQNGKASKNKAEEHFSRKAKRELIRLTYNHLVEKSIIVSTGTGTDKLSPDHKKNLASMKLAFGWSDT